MIIIYKITDYFPESNRIAVKFCREKSSKSIDDYNAVAINFEDIDTHDVESFSESLINKSGLRRLDKQDRKITTLDENISEKLMFSSKYINIHRIWFRTRFQFLKPAET